MNTRTITNAATALAVAAATFAGCAAEEVTPSSGPVTSSPSSGPTGSTTTNAAGGPVTTTHSTATVATVTNTTAASGTTGGAVTNTAAAGVTNTTAPAVTTAAAGNTTGGAAATSGGGCDLDPGNGTAPMIDDFEDNDHTILTNEGRVGYWYEYNDKAAAGTQTTAPIDGVDGMGGVLTTTGSGFPEYAGVGVDLNNQAGDPCEYDASFYTGIQFNITTTTAILFKVALTGTAGDSGHYEFAIAAADSGVVKVPFTGLAQPTWAETAAWDPATILQLQWQAAADDAFDITLDDVSFY